MKYSLKSILALFLLVVDLCLFQRALLVFNDNCASRFSITDPDSLYIIVLQDRYKDNIVLAYHQTTIGLSYDRKASIRLASIFNLPRIDYFIDYTLFEQLDLKVDEFRIISSGGTYVVGALNFNFVYVFNADEISFSFIQSVLDKVDILKVNCIDETLYQHPLFRKPIYNLIINRCSISDSLLENLYEDATDIYVLSDKALLIKYKANVLSIVELPI